MSHFSEEESNVARHYNEAFFDEELSRLPKECPVELAVTQLDFQRLFLGIPRRLDSDFLW